MKTLKKAEENRTEIKKHFEVVSEIEKEQSTNVIDNELQDLVESMKVADISTERQIVIANHKKTFPIRQQYRQANESFKLVAKFPRFFDVDGLVRIVLASFFYKKNSSVAYHMVPVHL